MVRSQELGVSVYLLSNSLPAKSLLHSMLEFLVGSTIVLIYGSTPLKKNTLRTSMGTAPTNS